MEKNNKKFILLSVILCVLIILAVFYFDKPIRVFDDNFFDNEIDGNADFIDPDSSRYFNYTATVRVDDAKLTNDLVPVNYIIEIDPKVPDTFPNVLVTAFLDDAMHNWIVTDNVLSFGTKKTEQITIGNDNNTGIVIGKTAWIKSGYDKDKLEKDLKLPIKIKISWDGNTEYAAISNVAVIRPGPKMLFMLKPGK